MGELICFGVTGYTGLEYVKRAITVVVIESLLLLGWAAN